MNYEKEIKKILFDCKNGRGCTLKEIYLELPHLNKKTIWKHLKQMEFSEELTQKIIMLKVYKME